MSKIKWITKKQVTKAAEKGEAHALECSTLHWHQLATCTFSELKTKLNQLSEPTDLLTVDYCSLCSVYFDNYCLGCPVGRCMGDGDKWKRCYDVFPPITEEEHAFFQIRAVTMYEFLESKRKEACK